MKRLRQLQSGLCLLAMIFYSVVPVQAIETAGEVFVNLDASTFNSGDPVWTNPGTYTDFEPVGNPLRSNIESTPAVVFDGSSAFVGGDLAPFGLVDLNPTRSIEAWVLNPSIAAEETIVSWGRRGGPDGTNMAFNYGNHGNFGAVGHWGGDGPDMGWIDNDFTPGAPEANKWHHLVYTFDGEVTRVYSDGELWNQEDTIDLWGDLLTWDDTPIAIASQWDGDAATLTGALRGSLALGRLRIHDEVLTDAQILSNYNEERADFVDPVPPPPPTAEPLPAPPIHRYSFNNPASNDATGEVVVDSIGGANGVVLGDGASFTGAEVRLEGGPSDVAAYVDLPNGLISKLTDATLETWVTVDGAANWSRVFDFGSNSPGGEDGELEGPGDDNGGDTQGLDYFFLSATRGEDANVQRVELRNEDPGGGGTTTIDLTDPRELPAEAHYAVVYDSDGAPLTGAPIIKVYRDGELMAEGATNIQLSDINDVNNWLGRSNWTNDANFEGSYDEFRIYDYALTQNQVIGNFESGPEVLNVGVGNACDLDGDGDCDEADIDALSAAVLAGNTDAKFDLNGDGTVDDADRTTWVRDLKNTWFGDANLDGEFNSSDFVAVFQIGEYEDATAANSGWAEGDWNGDAEFTSSDFVTAFQDGGFEQGPRAAVASVPEPGGLVLIGWAVCGLLWYRRRRRTAG